MHECLGSFNVSETPGKKESEEEKTSKIKQGVCDRCDEWVKHIQAAAEGRKEYRKDADTIPEEGVFIVSADMQKFIMLPRLPGNKTAVFTRRIVMYHETFAPLQPQKEVKKKWRENNVSLRDIRPLGMIWHEAIQGRKDEEICSTVIK